MSLASDLKRQAQPSVGRRFFPPWIRFFHWLRQRSSCSNSSLQLLTVSEPTVPADSFPQLVTDRLILRAFRHTDLAALYAIFSDARVTRFYDLDTFTSQHEAERMLAWRMPGPPGEVPGAMRWAICQSHDPDTVIGSCGFHSCNAGWHSIEIGYELHPACWGHGYAREAVQAMLDHCFTHELPFRVNRVAATTDLDSERSMRLLRGLGFIEEGVLRQYGFWKGKFHDVRLFSLLRQDWERC